MFELTEHQRTMYDAEPWAQLARKAGFEPYHTESAARNAFRFAAKREESLVEALKPFANTVYYDNGDVTIDESHLRISDYVKVWQLRKEFGYE